MTVSMGKKYVTRNGLYDAKVVYIHDSGERPVVVFAENKKDAALNTTLRTHLNGRIWHDYEVDLDLIEVPTIEDYYAAFEKGWSELSHFTTPKQGHIAGIKAVLKLAGVKV